MSTKTYDAGVKDYRLTKCLRLSGGDHLHSDTLGHPWGNAYDRKRQSRGMQFVVHKGGV